MNKLHFLIPFVVALLTHISCVNDQNTPTTNNWNYPSIKTDTVINVYFGKTVIDAYRNLENLDDTNVYYWYKEQRVLFDSVINNVTGRDSLKNNITNYFHSTKILGGLPRPANNLLFFKQYFTKIKSYKICCAHKTDTNFIELLATDTLLIKGNKITYVNYIEPSYDGRHLLLSFSNPGDESSFIKVLNVETKSFLPHTISSVAWSRAVWATDNSGYYFRQLREMDDSKNKVGYTDDMKLKYHKLNTATSYDKIIFSRNVTKGININKADIPDICVSPASTFSFIELRRGSTIYFDLFYTPKKSLLTKHGKDITWKKAFDSSDKVFNFSVLNNQLFAITTEKKSNGELIRINLHDSTDSEVLLTGEDFILEGLVQNKNSIYVKSLKNGYNILHKISLKDYSVRKIELPFNGDLKIRPTDNMTSSYLNSNDLPIGLKSWNKEWGAYYFEENTVTFTRLNTRPKGKYSEPEHLIVKNIEIPSHDGTLVPLTIVHSKNVKLNGKNPTMLYAYGGYGHTVKPHFDVAKLAWFDFGGIYAVAHVRGGGAKGESWRLGGFKATKSNSWKDFIACAQYLIDNKYTSPAKLGIHGGSAGGVTLGRAITEAPELFKVAYITVGTLSVMRREQSGNTSSIAEYGDINDSIEFPYLYEMDSYHHIKKDKCYPAMLLTAGLNDSRVAPWMIGKFVATMQNLDCRVNPVLFKVTEAGHFGGAEYVNSLADQYSFFLWQMNEPGFTYLK